MWADWEDWRNWGPLLLLVVTLQLQRPMPSTEVSALGLGWAVHQGGVPARGLRASSSIQSGFPLASTAAVFGLLVVQNVEGRSVKDH